MDLDHDQTTIAIAEGILVERHRITPAEAAQLLADLIEELGAPRG